MSKETLHSRISVLEAKLDMMHEDIKILTENEKRINKIESTITYFKGFSAMAVIAVGWIFTRIQEFI
jgi:hypothetical protein